LKERGREKKKKERRLGPMGKRQKAFRKGESAEVSMVPRQGRGGKGEEKGAFSSSGKPIPKKKRKLRLSAPGVQRAGYFC